MTPLSTRLAVDNSVSLGEHVYKVIDFLGQGAVAEAYLAQIDDYYVIIKLLHERWLDANGIATAMDSSDTDSPPPPDPYQQFKDEARVLSILNTAEDERWQFIDTVSERIARAAETADQRVIIANFDAGIAGDKMAGRPYIIQEPAPAAISYQPIVDKHDELRVLQVMLRVAQGIRLAHENQISLRDFRPLEKIDRIRVLWDEDAQKPQVRLIDWNISGGPELATRDLYYFGYYLYYLLLGEEVDDPPPARLGSGVSAWETITEGSRMLLRRLLHRDASRRYQSARSLVDDLDWWMKTLSMSIGEHPVERLRERCLDAMRRDRSDRLLAAAELALSIDIPEKDVRTFRTFQEQAKDDLEKEIRYAIASIEISLRTGQFSRAVKEAEKELIHLDAEGETARRVRHLKLLAEVGAYIKKEDGRDPRTLSVWQLLIDGVQSLIDLQWDAAAKKFRNAEFTYDSLSSIKSFVWLKKLSAAGQTATYAQSLRESARPYGPDILAHNWETIEEKKIQVLQQACQEFHQAGDLAPQETMISDMLRACEKELTMRRSLMGLLTAMKAAIERKDYLEATQRLQEVLKLDAGNAYATRVRPDVLRFARYQEAIESGKRALSTGEYEQARDRFEMAFQMMPEEKDASQWLSLARVAYVVQQEMNRRLTKLEQKLSGTWDASDLLRIKNDLARLSQLANKPWREVLSDFALAGEAASLQDVAHEIIEAHPIYRLTKADEERIGRLKNRISEAIDKLVEEERGRLETSSQQGEFDVQLSLGQEFLALLPADKRETLINLDRRNTEARQLEKELLLKLREVKGESPLEVLKAIKNAFQPLAEQTMLPETLRNESHLMVTALADFLRTIDDEAPGAIDLPQSLPEDVSWPPLKQARDMSIDAAATEISDRAEKAFLQKDFRRVIVWLDSLESYHWLSEREKVWREQAESKLAGYDDISKKIDSIKELLLAKEQEGITPQRAEEISDLLRSAWEYLRNDTSSFAESYRREIRALWRRLVHSALKQNAAIGNIIDLIQGGLDLFGDDEDLRRDLLWLKKAEEIDQLRHHWINELGEIVAPPPKAMREFVDVIRNGEPAWRSLLDPTVEMEWRELQAWTRHKQMSYQEDMVSLIQQWLAEVQRLLSKKLNADAARYGRGIELQDTHLWPENEVVQQYKGAIQEANYWAWIQKRIEALYGAEEESIYDDIKSMDEELGGKEIENHLPCVIYKRWGVLRLLSIAMTVSKLESKTSGRTHYDILAHQVHNLNEMKKVPTSLAPENPPVFFSNVEKQLYDAAMNTGTELAKELRQQSREVESSAGEGKADIAGLITSYAQVERSIELLGNAFDDASVKNELTSVRKAATAQLLCNLNAALVTALEEENFLTASNIADTMKRLVEAYRKYGEKEDIRNLSFAIIDDCAHSLDSIAHKIPPEDPAQKLSFMVDYLSSLADALEKCSKLDDDIDCQ